MVTKAELFSMKAPELSLNYEAIDGDGHVLINACGSAADDGDDVQPPPIGRIVIKNLMNKVFPGHVGIARIGGVFVCNV